VSLSYSGGVDDPAGLCFLSGGVPLELMVNDAGELETRSVPDGEYPVLVYASKNGVTLRGTGRARTGEVTEIPLAPR
jgi:hypothetical protein